MLDKRTEPVKRTGTKIDTHSRVSLIKAMRCQQKWHNYIKIFERYSSFRRGLLRCQHKN